MKKLVSTAITSANIATLTDLLAAASDRLQLLSQPFPVAQLHQPLGTGERSFRDVLAHLLNCEAKAAGSIYLALVAPEPVLPALHPERHFGKLLRYDLLPISDLLAYFRIRRIVLGRVLAALTPAHWGCAIQEVGKQRQETVYALARAMALHEQEHLAALERQLNAG
jgi:hypothetical protein